mmetsp:Transcript_8807/g.20027  ORF Transcript_8807/g.20027 Transcript_8807/m.20027 type:complete len:85 (+) Transcript_8807:547-801(+)
MPYLSGNGDLTREVSATSVSRANFLPGCTLTALYVTVLRDTVSSPNDSMACLLIHVSLILTCNVSKHIVEASDRDSTLTLISHV